MTQSHDSLGYVFAEILAQQQQDAEVLAILDTMNEALRLDKRSDAPEVKTVSDSNLPDGITTDDLPGNQPPRRPSQWERDEHEADSSCGMEDDE